MTESIYDPSAVKATTGMTNAGDLPVGIAPTSDGAGYDLLVQTGGDDKVEDPALVPTPELIASLEDEGKHIERVFNVMNDAHKAKTITLSLDEQNKLGKAQKGKKDFNGRALLAFMSMGKDFDNNMSDVPLKAEDRKSLDRVRTLMARTKREQELKKNMKGPEPKPTTAAKKKNELKVIRVDGQKAVANLDKMSGVNSHHHYDVIKIEGAELAVNGELLITAQVQDNPGGRLSPRKDPQKETKRVTFKLLQPGLESAPKPPTGF